MALAPLALRPHDVAVALQLTLTPGAPYQVLATAVGLSRGEAHNVVKRLATARLVRPADRKVNLGALLEFVTAGVPYAFPGELGPETRGVPTAYSAPPLAAEIPATDAVVWPSADGTVRGASLQPLYPGAPATPQRNPKLYELLTLVDAMRIGRARERQRARTLLQDRLTAAANASGARPAT